MNPRLIAISGPLEGQACPLERTPLRIGRHADNDLQLASVEVSRHHCEVRRDPDGGYRVVDLDSRHGIFVNGRPVRARALVHSDLLSVGGSVLLFLLDDSTAAAGAPPERPEPSFVAASTMARKPTDVLYLDRARMEAALPEQARIARDLHVLLRASGTLIGPLDPAALGARLLDALLEAVPAERAAVLLREPGSATPRALATRQRGGGGGAGEAVDLVPGPEVLEPMLAQKVGLLSVGADGAGGAPGALLLAPLLDRDQEVIGAVYGDSRSPAAFDERHLELAGALAALAAPALENALRLRWLERENERLRGHQLAHDIVGESAPIVRLLDRIARVARAETTVLIRGESGTGKELAAQAIHRSSARAGGPFVAINCATLSETLIESELFGHEKGAFTGAIARAVGKVEAAAGGTLFLDEVGEIPPGLQAKLLRVLQERTFERVGGSRPIAADVRVIAATNRDLEAAIRQGAFREDLYYRLKVIALEVPPLRARPGDVSLLASHFLALHGRRLGRRGVTLSAAARRCLEVYPWPGNVRELGNVVERALVLGDGDVIHPEDLPEELLEAGAETPGTFAAALRACKEKLVLDAYADAGGDYAAAAALLGVHVNSLHRMIRRLGLKERL